jgi:hypothetical protein
MPIKLLVVDGALRSGALAVEVHTSNGRLPLVLGEEFGIVGGMRKEEGGEDAEEYCDGAL